MYVSSCIDTSINRGCQLLPKHVSIYSSRTGGWMVIAGGYTWAQWNHFWMNFAFCLAGALAPNRSGWPWEAFLQQYSSWRDRHWYTYKGLSLRCMQDSKWWLVVRGSDHEWTNHWNIIGNTGDHWFRNQFCVGAQFLAASLTNPYSLANDNKMLVGVYPAIVFLANHCNRNTK